MLKKLFLFLSSFILLAGLGACSSGSSDQISGIGAAANIKTIACVEGTRSIKLRNDLDEAQFFRGVHFEFGASEAQEKYFKILEVTANGDVKNVSGSMSTDVAVAPGGILEVKVAYEPDVVTVEGECHYAYLDFVMNGPKVGVMQVELCGQALTAAEGCVEGGAGVPLPFSIDKATAFLAHVDQGVVETDITANVSGDFVLKQNGDEVTLNAEGWPQVAFPLPPNGFGLSELVIAVEGSSDTVDFSSGSLELTGITFDGGGVITLENVTLTTGQASVSSAEAPNVPDGSFSLTGSDLDSEGKMSLVAVVPLTVPPVNTVDGIGGGAFAIKLDLIRQ